MDYTIHLPIYGPIEHGSDRALAWNLYQTHAAARLRDISLSSVPAAFTPHGMPASRFQHSVAVGHLAYLASQHLGLADDERNILVASALLHDSGSPPFSHISEVFLHELTGRHHEAEVQRVLREDPSVRATLERHAVDPAAVLANVTGVRPITGPLTAGTIDLDNIDNSLHLLHSLTGLDPLPYRPEHLVRAFRLLDGADGPQLGLSVDGLSDVLAWNHTRRRLYDVLYAPETLSAAAGLYRALELAFADGALAPEFFELGEGPALEVLRRCHPGAGHIIEALSTWHHYPQVVRLEQDLDLERLRALAGDWRARQQIADRVAAELDLRPEQVAVYVGVDKGAKRIALPWSGERAEAAAGLFTDAAPTGRVALFCQADPAQIEAVAERVLVQALDEARPQAEPHAFF